MVGGAFSRGGALLETIQYFTLRNLVLLEKKRENIKFRDK